MTDMSEFSEWWKDRIRRDLASFSDPGTPVEVVGAGRSFEAAWTVRGDAREGMFSVSLDQGVTVKVGNRHLPYRSFVAGPDMADLETVARMIIQASKPGLFIETRAEYDDDLETSGRGTEQGPAIDVLTNLIEGEGAVATRVIMVTGDAGAGKTRVLKELVNRQANKFVRKETAILLLYVNAQGRALARLNEALATELQDLRVGLTYHSIASLTRLGILIPVIDGFDELLGVSGYDDAFSSLSGFLEQLEGEGQMLASARSVYYEQEFLSRAGNVSATGSQAWEYAPVRVLEWRDEDRERYMNDWIKSKDLSDTKTKNICDRVRTIFDNENRDLASKPLFFTKTVELLWREPNFRGGQDLLQALVNEYLSRECKEKLLDRQSDPLLTVAQFERLMRELAEEMWNQETRELDYRSVRDVAEYVVEHLGLSQIAKQTIIERMPTLAFLTGSDDSTPRVGTFEHELFFFYFLADSISSRFSTGNGDDMRIVLSRAALPENVAERVAKELNAEGPNTPGRLQEHLDRLAKVGNTEWRRGIQVRENAGLLAMALLRAYAESNGLIEGCDIRSVIFPGSHLRDVSLEKCSLTSVTIHRTDLTSTKFLDCESKDTLFWEPIVSPEETRLELRGLDAVQVTGIRTRGETVYAPGGVAEIMKRCGASIPLDSQHHSVPRVSEEYLKLLDRLMRAYRRANPICMDDDHLTSLFKNSKWKSLERMLVDHDLVRKEHRQKGGRKSIFLRRQFLPNDFMSGQKSGVDERIRRFWKALEQES